MTKQIANKVNVGTLEKPILSAKFVKAWKKEYLLRAEKLFKANKITEEIKSDMIRRVNTLKCNGKGEAIV